MQVRQPLLTLLLGVSLAPASWLQTPPIITGFSPTVSATGLPVYISGTYFTSATSVTFNGMEAPFLVNSPALIVALIPLNATSGFVQVTTAAGTASSSQPLVIVRASWHAVKNFSMASNPNGAWTYGVEPSLRGEFTPFTIRGACFTNGPCWWNAASFPNASAVELNTAPYTQQVLTVIIPNNMLYLAVQANVTVVRWTAPASGTFSIYGLFQGLDLLLPNVTVAIYENGTTSLFSNSLTSFEGVQEFSLTNVTLEAGTTIDFVATSTDPYDDNVGLVATIDQIR